MVKKIEEMLEESYYYQKDNNEKLNFIECLQLLDTLIKNNILFLDPNNKDNVIVYWSGDELNPEGWYSRNIHDVAGEVFAEEEQQHFLRDVLKEKEIELKFKVIPGFIPQESI